MSVGDRWNEDFFRVGDTDVPWVADLILKTTQPTINPEVGGSPYGEWV